MSNEATEKAPDRIEKRIELKAPVSRVWQAITDYQQFGEWFQVKLDQPFASGQISTGHITYPGYEHMKWYAIVQQMEPERLFSFSWPHAESLGKPDAPPIDYAKAPFTLVEFRLEPTAGGTLLVITESGFEKIPVAWRLDAFRRNDGGWTQQTHSIEKYLAQKA